MAYVRTCRNCRRLFTDYAGRHLCASCMKEEDEIFDRVKEYIRANPGCTIFSTSEACEVSETLIRQWLREERLEYKEQEGTGLYCERCGEPILTGRYCNKCKMALSRELGAIMRTNEKPAVAKKPVEHGSRMRFLTKGT